MVRDVVVVVVVDSDESSGVGDCGVSGSWVEMVFEGSLVVVIAGMVFEGFWWW